MQKPTDGEEEEDGKDECNCIPSLFSLQIMSTLLTMTDIVTSDDEIIQDNVSLCSFLDAHHSISPLDSPKDAGRPIACGC